MRKKWTPERDAKLAKLYDEEKLSPLQIAERLGGPVQSIRVRLTKLRKDGKVGPSHRGK